MAPLADISDAGSEYRLVLDVPGVREGNVEVTAGPSPGTISIKAKTSSITESQGRPVLKERTQAEGERSLHRVLPIGWDADVDAAKSWVDAGILTIVVPKKAPEKRDERPVKATKSQS